MTNSSGDVVWKAAYKTFGEAVVDSSSTITNNFRFPGQYYDEETGLHYNYHRYYDPGTGRYLSADPIGLRGGINLYIYVENNPLILFDPIGLKKCVGMARVLQGNQKTIGRYGAFPNVKVATCSAAIIPQQFGGMTKEGLAPHIGQVSGVIGGGDTYFQGVTDVIGGKSPCPGKNVRDCLQGQYPDLLIIEIPGEHKDYGIIDIELDIPNKVPCPAGTVETR